MFEAFIQILLIVTLSLNQTLLTFLLYVDKPGWPKWFWQFLCECLCFLNPKGFYYSYVWSCSLCEGRTSFAQDLSLENSADSYLYFQLTLLQSLSYFFFVYWSPSSFCTVFDSTSSDIDQVLSVNLLMYLSLESSGWADRLVNSVIILLSQTILLR